MYSGLWRWLSYAYATLVVAGLGYFLYDLPIQVADGYGDLVKASRTTLGTLVYREFDQAGYLRPMLWGQARLVYDLSEGAYYEWFRGWHVGQVALLPEVHGDDALAVEGELEVQVDQRLEDVGRRSSGGAALPGPVEQPVDERLDHGDEQRLLGGEVAVDARAHDPGAAADVLHADGRIAALPEQPGRSDQQVVAPGHVSSSSEGRGCGMRRS